MRIFAVYTKLSLTEQPDWLDEFRKKYDEPWHFHNTLKQPCFIEDEKVPMLRNKLDHFFLNRKLPGKMTVRFDEVVAKQAEPDSTIMIRAQSAGQLVNLQRALLSALVQYTNYVDARHQEYEKNFEPHITIGRDLPARQYREALKYLKNGCVCVGTIQEIVLAVVKDDTVEEGMNPANHTVYRL